MITRGEGGWAKWVNGGDCMVMDGNYTCGAVHLKFILKI